MSAEPSRGKWVIGFMIRSVLFGIALFWIFHYDEQFDFSPLTVFGLFVAAAVVVVLVDDLVLKRLGLSS